ncbi:MAG: hypothetical protein ACOCRK_08375 [bacterium]
MLIGILLASPISTDQTINALDLINKMDSFYNNAWTKLTSVLGFGFLILTVITAWGQKRLYDSKKEEIEAYFNKMFTEYKDNLDQSYEKKFNKLKSEYKKEIKSINEELNQTMFQNFFYYEAEICRIQADNYYDNKDYQQALTLYINAVKTYGRSSNDKHIELYFTNIIECLDKLDEDKILFLKKNFNIFQGINYIINNYQNHIKYSDLESIKTILEEYES